jgi:hypothetical protein
MIHYHGGPITPETVAFKVWRARHAMVSFAHPRQIEIAADVCQSFAIDNGAFSAWRAGKAVIDWSEFYRWCSRWLNHPGCDFALIPDVVDGGEAENDALIAEWPFGTRGTPVWHLHESIGRLIGLARGWPRVAFGSSAEYADVGTVRWWLRMGEAMVAIRGGDQFPICRIHGLRMLDPRVFSRLPLASADSTNVARNVGIDCAWKGTYVPRSRETRGLVLAERIEERNSAPRWRELTQGNRDWLENSAG